VRTEGRESILEAGMLKGEVKQRGKAETGKKQSEAWGRDGGGCDNVEAVAAWAAVEEGPVPGRFASVGAVTVLAAVEEGLYAWSICHGQGQTSLLAPLPRIQTVALGLCSSCMLIASLSMHEM